MRSSLDIIEFLYVAIVEEDLSIEQVIKVLQILHKEETAAQA